MASNNKLKARQTELKAAQTMLGSAANATLDTVFPLINNEMAKLFEDRNALLVGGGLITFTGTQIQFSENLVLTLNQLYSGSGTLSISLGSSTVTLANGEIWYAVIDRSLGTATTAVASSLGQLSSSQQERFLIARRQDAGDGTQRVYFRNGMALDAGQTVRLGSAGSGGEGNGVLEPVPGYKMLISDSFSSTVGSSDDTVYSTFTNASYDAGKKLYRLACDKSRSVSSSSGTLLVINSAPSFTVQPGDIVYVLSGARANQFRRIVTVNAQDDYVLDASFTGGDASASDSVMVSQAVWTQDLINFGSATELTRPRDFYPNENVNQILIDYTDSLALGDDVGDFTEYPRLSMRASNEGLQADTDYPLTTLFNTSSYSRPFAPNMLEDYALPANTDNERLFLVFFPNISNGAVLTGANLLDYAVNFYEEAAAINGGVLATAFGTSDNSTTSYNGTISTSSSQTRIDLNFDVNPNVDTGGVGAQVAVKVNGQDVPKFVSSGVTPAGSLYYTVTTDANGLYRRILFSLDLSVSPVEIMVIKQFGVVDLSFTQTNKLTGLYDAIVGSAAQVSSGAATHSSLQAAHDAVVAGSNILVLNNVTLSGNTTLSKRLMVIGKGPGSNLTGNLTITSGALGSNIKDLRIEGNITFNSGADKCFMVGCFQANGYSFSNDPANLDNVIEVIVE